MAVYKDGILYVDNSTLSSFQTCPTAAMLKYGYNLRPSEVRNSPAEAGTAVHKALEVYLGGGTRNEAFEAFHTAYFDYSLANIPSGDRLGYDNVILVLESWIDRNLITELPYRTKGPEYTEVAFDLPLVDGIHFVGAIDALVERKDGKAFYVLDTKSTGNPDAKFRNQFDLGSQMTGYVWAAQQLFDLPISGIFINVVHMAVVPTSGAKCYKHKLPYHECGFLHPNHTLIGPKLRTPKALAEWKKDTIDIAQRWRDNYLKYGDDVENIVKLPQYGKWVYQACALCDYREFCRTGRNVKKGVSFDYVEWKPGKTAELD